MIRTLLAAALLGTPALAQAPLTVVKLFQSQGCSSCPPANANVNALIAGRADVLALSYAVTYWDQLGWKDRFASASNTQRQWARTLPHRNIVRDLTRLGRWSDPPATFRLPPAPTGLATAILVQAGRGGAILAAARG